MHTKAKLFEYVIIWHPTEEQEKLGDKAIILVDLTRVLAKDALTVQTIAAREIPAHYMDKISQIEILIRQ